MNRIKNLFHDIIRDIKINPKTFYFGFLIGFFLLFFSMILSWIDFSPPAWKTLEKDIDNNISNTKKLLQHSKTDEETSIIEELISKQEELKNIIPQGKKERIDFLEKYDIEMDLIISRYRAFLYKNNRLNIYKKKKPNAPFPI